jgi:hypothetical protein
MCPATIALSTWPALKTLKSIWSKFAKQCRVQVNSETATSSKIEQILPITGITAPNLQPSIHAVKCQHQGQLIYAINGTIALNVLYCRPFAFSAHHYYARK